MRKRGRRRSSKRRKSSGSNKQDSSSTADKDNVKKDDQNVLSASEKEKKSNGEEEEEEEEDGHMNLAPKANIVYMKTTKDKETGVKVTTSVSVSDMEDSAPRVTFQLSHQLPPEHHSSSSTPLTTEMTRTKSFALKLKVDMEERTEATRRAVQSEFHLTYGDDCEDPPAVQSLDRHPGHAWASKDARTQADTRFPTVPQDLCEKDFRSGGVAPPTDAPPLLRGTALEGLALSALHHTHLHLASAQRGCVFPMKRCHTFPGRQEELLLPHQGCVWSLILSSLPFKTVCLQQEEIRRSSFGSWRPQRPPSSQVPEDHNDLLICRLNQRRQQTTSGCRHENNQPDREGHQGGVSEGADGWFYQLEGEDPGLEEPPRHIAAEHPSTSPPADPALPEWSQDTNCLLEDAEDGDGEQKQEAERRSSHSSVSADKQEELQTDETRNHSDSRLSADTGQRLRPVDGGVSDHWAVKRKLFKENKQWSSAGGSSVTSDMMEEQAWEDCPPVDVTPQDEDRGFYAETFYSSAWVYQGDDGSGELPPSLNSRTRTVSVRERTVKISKGTGDYPWGFRIQFSKPIVVTEVDTNGAAEEAGLMVGDYVLAVNGTDVTSIPHSEAANLARQGPDLLTLTIGSDIGRYPSSPRPACRGYLYKRTQSGLIKGWRKRWFVLTHERCLCYYRHRRDQGKQRPLQALRLEGAEVRPDASLGKPFVFRCCPQASSRVFFFCATSSQEMKRWLVAMETAIRPVPQSHVWEDVTRHNCSLPPLAVKSPERLGLLHKLDRSRDAWVQHYCILKDGCLSFYSGIRATHAQGGIYLQGYTVREQSYGSKKSSIELKPPSDEFKTFYFCAENATENKRWIVALKASVTKWLPLHQALQDFMSQPPEETRM